MIERKSIIASTLGVQNHGGSGGDVDLSEYRKYVDQDVIDAALTAKVTALEDKAERFVVHCTASSIPPFGGAFDIATDKSFNDILSAYNSNREVCAILTSSAMQGVAFLTGIAPDAAIFYTLITLGSQSNLMYLLVCISNDKPFGVLMSATYDDTDLSNRVSALETALTGLDEVIG